MFLVMWRKITHLQVNFKYMGSLSKIAAWFFVLLLS